MEAQTQKQLFVAREIEKNISAFGRWHSTSMMGKADPQKLLSELPPRDEIEAIQHGNALASTGYYPVGTSECFNVGISGGCGEHCFVLRKGECTEP